MKREKRYVLCFLVLLSIFIQHFGMPSSLEIRIFGICGILRRDFEMKSLCEIKVVDSKDCEYPLFSDLISMMQCIAKF